MDWLKLRQLCCHAALKIDPRYGIAAIFAGYFHIVNAIRGRAIEPKSEMAEEMRLLQLALSIDRE